MDKLPTEILHSIFIQIDLKQRLECMYVCRRWWKVLDRCSLFYSVIIRDNFQFNKFMDLFERMPQYASQVEEFGVKMTRNINFNERNLFDIFPNVRMISLESNSLPLGQTSRHSIQDTVSTHARSKLEYLSDWDCCEVASQLLNLELGDRLETLVLNFFHLRGAWSGFSQLKNLPVLKKLYLSYPHIKVDELETIHNNVPSIQTLSLQSATLLAGSIPSNIAPATFITDLHFSARRYAYENQITCHQVYQYLIKKYTNINKVEYHDIGLSHYSNDQRRYIYMNGILEFLEMIASKQSKLCLQCVLDDINPFEVLGHAQIKDLHLIECKGRALFRYLRQSKQSRSIEWLYMLDTTFGSMYPIRNLIALTALYIEYESLSSTRIYLTNLLDGCPPKLVNISIQNADLFVGIPFTKKNLNPYNT